MPLQYTVDSRPEDFRGAVPYSNASSAIAGARL
jgi:hypothetical protein